MTRVFKFGFVLSMLTVLGVAIARGEARGFVGPGTFVIITPSGEAIGKVDGRRVDRPAADADVTIRLQTQQVAPEPRSWNPEPSSCPRGVKVMRYGSWGC